MRLMRVLIAFLIATTFLVVQAQQPETTRPAVPLRPVHTFSIVARDPETGELGVAVQSHWFSVGSIVTWARPGVGAVATQSVAEPAYGPRLLDRLPPRAEAHPGDVCRDFAGHRTGPEFSAQANMMASEAVWPAMAAAFEAAAGPLE